MSQWDLMTRSRFLPLFLTQGLGALNDNIFRNALIVLATYRLAEEAGLAPAQFAAIATGLFILPYFLFSALAGQLSDRYEKSSVIRTVKFVEIGLALLAGLAFASGDPVFLLAVLFAFGTQAAFFSPVKFAILPQHLGERDLIGGNALLELGTFVAILLGSILGTILILGANGLGVVTGLLVAIAVAGYVSARRIPHAEPSSPDMQLRYNLAGETVRLISYANQNRAVLWGILGIAWFWMIGGLYVTQLAPYTKSAIGADQTVVTWLLAVFTIGIGTGALVCNRLLRSVISPRFVLAAAVGWAVFAADLWLATMDGPQSDKMTGLGVFLGTVQGWRVSVDLFLLAVCAGVYSVPLYALVQARSAADVRARTIAAGNIIIAVFTVVGALATTALLGLGLNVQELYGLGAGLLVAGALVIHTRLAGAT